MMALFDFCVAALLGMFALVLVAAAGLFVTSILDEQREK